jgi:hypothetical protein
MYAAAPEETLTDTEIQHEINEAKKFTPELRKLIIAYNGPRAIRRS